MNLRIVHFCLILISAVLAVGFGVWLLRGSGGGGSGLSVLGAIASFAVAVGLVVYDRWFLGKTRGFR